MRSAKDIQLVSEKLSGIFMDLSSHNLHDNNILSD